MFLTDLVNQFLESPRGSKRVAREEWDGSEHSPTLPRAAPHLQPQSFQLQAVLIPSSPPYR